MMGFLLPFSLGAITKCAKQTGNRLNQLTKNRTEQTSKARKIVVSSWKNCCEWLAHTGVTFEIVDKATISYLFSMLLAVS